MQTLIDPSRQYHFDRTIEEVRKHCHALFKQSPISHFELSSEELIYTAKQYDLVYLPVYLDGCESDNEALLDASKSFQLTLRESDCVSLLARGFSMKAAAAHLGISPRTVEQHIRNAKEKHGLHSKQQLLELWHAS